MEMYWGGCCIREMEEGLEGNPVQSTYSSFSIGVITPKIGQAADTSSHSLQFLSRPFRGRHTTCACTHTDLRCDQDARTHWQKKKKRRSIFLSVFASTLPSVPPSPPRPPFPFPPACSVSISCDIPFCFFITALVFVLLVPNNFIDGGHKAIDSLSRAACRAQRQIHGMGVLGPPAARVLWVCAELLYIATLGRKVLFFFIFNALFKVIIVFLLGF